MNFLALKAILVNSKRSVHVVIAVALSVAIIYSSFVVADGFVERVESMSGGYTISDILYVVDKEAITLSAAEISSLSVALIPEDAKVLQVILCEVTVSGRNLELWGVDFDDFSEVRRPIVIGQIPQDKYEVLVGANLAEKYGVTLGSIIEARTENDELNLFVTGIVRSNGQYDNGLVIRLETAQELRPELDNHVSLIEIYTSDAFGLLESLDLSIFGLKVVQGLAMQDYIIGLALEIKSDLYLISAVITFLAMISVSHTMYKILSDSMGELLILRSIGLSKRGLLQVIIFNSIILSLAGAIVGFLLGNLLSNTASIFSFLVLETVFLPVKFNPSIYLFCLSISVGLGVVGGIVSIIIMRPTRETYGAVKSL